MQLEYQTNYEGFKEMALHFFTRLRTKPKPEQVQAGLKMLGIALIHMSGDTIERFQAESILAQAYHEAAGLLG